MECYEVNKKKKKKAVNKFIAYQIPSSTGFIKASYYCEKILKALSFILAIINIVVVLVVTHEPIDLFFLTMTFGFPFLFSFIPRTVYRTKLGNEYLQIRNEKITIDEQIICYDYNGILMDPSDICRHYFSVNDIDRVEYNSKSSEISLYGDFQFYYYQNDTITNKLEAECVTLLDIFDVDLISFFRQNNIEIKEV